MPRILLVEDEPAAGRYLRSVIELHHPDFSVVGIAEDGRDALEQVRRLDPDLVITDVKMPVMDGIEFVAELKKKFSDLPALIVSGYQEFEYARRALDTGVVDYLLKPVSPSRLREVLDRLMPVLAAREDSRRLEFLVRCIDGDCRDAIASLAADDRFWLAVARSGGLPSRFRWNQARDDNPGCVGGFHTIPGRDSREKIYLGRAAQLPYERFTAAVRAATGAFPEEPAQSYRTVLVASAASGPERLHDAVRDLCLDLDKILVVGLSQVHYGEVGKTPENDWDKPLADRMDFALKESRMDLLKQAVLDMSKTWRKARTPLIAVESQLRRILLFVLRKAPQADLGMEADLEFFLDEELSAARSFDDLAASAWTLVARAAGAGAAEFREVDVPAFFCAIKRYVETRYAEPLTLGSLSANFRISSSYLSKLFRQHADRSFGEFLSTIRIDAAKRLIVESPDMPLKNVAERVGFCDPFYFSRVFKSVTGYPPSDYARRSDGKSITQCETLHVSIPETGVRISPGSAGQDPDLTGGFYAQKDDRGIRDHGACVCRRDGDLRRREGKTRLAPLGQ